MVNEKMNLIVAEQVIAYTQPIRNFQQFNVTTTVSTEGDKWLYFHHSFEDKAEGTALATVKVKAVLKAGTGKTVRPSEVVATSPYFRDLLS
jgi:acyl-CoA thioesterase FadM